MAPTVAALQQAGLPPVQLPEQEYNLPDSLSPVASPQSSPRPVGVEVVLHGLLPQLSVYDVQLATEDSHLTALCQLPSPEDLPLQYVKPRQEQFSLYEGCIEHQQLQPCQQLWHGLQQCSNGAYAQSQKASRISDTHSHSGTITQPSAGWQCKPLSSANSSMHPCQRKQGSSGMAPVSAAHIELPLPLPLPWRHGDLSSTSTGAMCTSWNSDRWSAYSSCSSSGSVGGPRSSSVCSSASTCWTGVHSDLSASFGNTVDDSTPGCFEHIASSLWSATPFTRVRSKSCRTSSCHFTCATSRDGSLASAQARSANSLRSQQRGSLDRHSYEGHSRDYTVEAKSRCRSRGSSTPGVQDPRSEQIAMLQDMPHHLLVAALEQRHAPTFGSTDLLVQRLAVLLQQEQQETAASAIASIAVNGAAGVAANQPEQPTISPESMYAKTASPTPLSNHTVSGHVAGVQSPRLASPTAVAAHLRAPWIEFEHQGVKYRFKRKHPVCLRCGSGGHGAWQCSLGYCGSCKAYGHAEGSGCAAACNRCGRVHTGEQQCKAQHCGKCKLFGHVTHNCPCMRCRRCGWYGHAVNLCSPAFACCEEAAEKTAEQLSAGNSNTTACAQNCSPITTEEQGSAVKLPGAANSMSRRQNGSNHAQTAGGQQQASSYKKVAASAPAAAIPKDTKEQAGGSRQWSSVSINSNVGHDAGDVKGLHRQQAAAAVSKPCPHGVSGGNVAHVVQRRPGRTALHSTAAQAAA